MKTLFFSILRSKREFLTIFKIVISSCIFIGSNHCVFEEVFTSFVTCVDRIVSPIDIPNQVESVHPHNHTESNADETHSHGQAHANYIIGLGQSIFLIMKFLGVLLISSLLLSLNFIFNFKKISVKLNCISHFWKQSSILLSLDKYCCIESPRAPPPILA